MAERRRSLSSTLLVRALVPLAAIWLIGALLMLYVMRVVVASAFDHELADTALALSSAVRTRDGRPEVELGSRTLDLMLFSETEELFFAVVDGAGRLVAGHQGLAPSPVARGEGPTLQDGRYGGRDVRIATFTLDSSAGGAPVTIAVAETMRRRQEAERVIYFYIFLPQVVLLGLLALLTRAGVRRALAPLQRLHDEIEMRSADDLRRLETDPPTREGHRLATAINELMDRLGRSIAAQKGFVGDAAHQLRTPLARLKATAEYALRQQDATEWRDALERTLASADSSVRLVNQLLALARADEASVERLPLEECDLVELARDATMPFVPTALKKNIDLGFETTLDRATVQAVPPLLGELVANLVDNAVRYTQAGGRITVRVARDDAKTILTVADNGPGIPPDEQARIFERFHRGPDVTEEGSGLGLAIVRAYASLMNAGVSVRSGATEPGTTAEVIFPLAGQHSLRCPA